MGNYRGVSLPDPEHSSLSSSHVIPFRVPGQAHEKPVSRSREQAYPLQGLGLQRVTGVVVVVVVVPPLESQRLPSPLLVTIVADVPVIILNRSYN